MYPSFSSRFDTVAWAVPEAVVVLIALCCVCGCCILDTWVAPKLIDGWWLLGSMAVQNHGGYASARALGCY